MLVRDRTRRSAPVAPPEKPFSILAPAPTARPVVLEGRILAANGDAVNGAHVRAISDGHAIAETLTDASGQFAFEKVASARVHVEADHDPEGAVDSVEVSISSTPTFLTLVLAPAGIGGQVVDGDDGHPIANASLSIEAPFAAATTASDPAGAFHFGAVPFEATAITATADGYRSTRVVLGSRENRAEPSLRIVLYAAPPIEGDVVDADGDPIHARVTACADTANPTRVETADDGTFKLPPSTIGCDAFATHDAMGASDTSPIVEGRHLTLRLAAAGSIAGFVVDDRGRSIDSFSVGVEAFVPLRGSSPAPRGTTPFTGGTFRIDHLTPGSYVLTAVTAGRPPARSGTIVVRSGAVTDRVTITIASGGVVEGRVTDDKHVPIEGVELHFDLVSSVAGSDASATTDASGRYRLEGAPAGPLTVSAHKDGYRTKLVSAITVASGATTTKDIALTPGQGLELTGIGASLRANGNDIVFGGVFPDNPAGVAGLRPGDRIVRIDGEETGSLSLADAIQHLRGEPGTVVGITVERGGETLDVAITRGEIVQ